MKERVEDFALFGGRPAFDAELHVGRPNQGDRRRFLERVEGILDRNWLTNNGPLVQEFEGEVAGRVGARHGVAISNGTIALEIAARALGFEGEVIVPSFTFVATVHALSWQRIQPVFCDIDPETHNIDPACIEALITPRTTGILAVNVWGRPCEVEELERIAARHGLGLLFDSSHAFGASHRGRMVGGLGVTEVFSFHATKLVNSFEGGVVVTDDDELAERMRLMRNFGFVDKDTVVHPGTNGKMTEVCAAMGLTTLESYADIVATNRRNYECYRDELRGIAGLKLIDHSGPERRNFQYIVCDLDRLATGFTRDILVDILTAEGVLARRYFWPGCHRMEPYRTLYPDAGRQLAHTEATSERTFQLPTGNSIDLDAVREISAIIRRAVELAPRISARLSGLGESDGVPTREPASAREVAAL